MGKVGEDGGKNKKNILGFRTRYLVQFLDKVSRVKTTMVIVYIGEIT